jgi:hypothetical protein
MNITRSDISRAIDNPTYYKRGVSYFLDRKVLMSRLRVDDRIVGSVAGSGGGFIRLTLRWAEVQMAACRRLMGIVHVRLGITAST